MLTQEENQLLTQTGPETTMGVVFRRYWQPALLSRELEVDGAPQAVKILGEDFVAFRDSDGEIGVVEPRCPHRGANLIFGRNESCGLRCAYHGWKFDKSGNCVDLPTSPDKIADKTKPKAAIRALKVQEWGDMVWVFFGEDAPPLPQMEFALLPESQRFVSKKLQQCNWAQAVEGGIDTAHFSFLHANISDGERVALLPSEGRNEPAALARYRWLIEDSMPHFTVLKHDAGLTMCASRTTDDEDQLYYRLTQFMMPNHSLAPNSFPGEMHQGNTWVPIDDHSCWIYCFAYHPDRPLTDQERRTYASGMGIFAAVDENYVPIRNRDNNYLLDRNVQKHSNFTGIMGISEQDAAIADSQGLIADRSREILGQTDLGVVRFRQMILGAANGVQNGDAPHGSKNAEAYRVRSGDAMASISEDPIDVVQRRFETLAGSSLQKS
ncbi:MAG: Rieske 2Fe-2S domain-containing protein [bacterium]|nr:aromatic ring-hydroxylating dioxygenase subunit alpha [Gammaproteobacteria bacterium]HIL94523.1 aromatic ring-hydroxylating dioxygenase subunit alpha [Pseudomonadales bacterium]